MVKSQLRLSSFAVVYYEGIHTHSALKRIGGSILFITNDEKIEIHSKNLFDRQSMAQSNFYKILFNYVGYSINLVKLPRELATERNVYICTFFKEINSHGSLHVTVDCQHHLLYWQLHLELFLNKVTGFPLVAVTDLFPLSNQCPRQAIRPHTDQSGAERIDSFFLSRTIFSILFWKSRQVREHIVSSQDRPLSRPLQQTFHMEPLH